MSLTSSHGALLAASLVLVPMLAMLPSGATGATDAEPSPTEHEDVRITPTPQHVDRRGPDLRLAGGVRVVTAEDADPAAVEEVSGILEAAGVEESDPLRPPQVTVRVAGPDGAAGTAGTLRRLGVKGPQGMPAGGYVLAIGRESSAVEIVLAGSDAAGQLYAAKSLSQVVRSRPGGAFVPALAVRDFPTMPWRGTIEGFYGEPWSHQDRIRQIDEYADDKMNAYIYAPKDDPYHRERWREPYSEEDLARLAELVRRGRRQHVDVVFTVSPGLDICYSDPSEQAALAQKAQQVWDVGVRTFGILLDDIGGELTCARDKERFGDDASPLAAAQAHLLNAFQRDFLDTHVGAGRLVTVPTEYAGNQSSSYRERFASRLDDRAVVMWTGPEVVSATVTDEDADAASAVFDHDLLLWDNYPVNDYLPRQLFLGPLAGRSKTLEQHGVVGITANPMPQAAPSLVALGTVADYAWNPRAYGPERSWDASIDDLGGRAADALRTFASNSRSSKLDPTESPKLAAAIEDSRAERRRGEPGDATRRLADLFAAMQHAPGELRARMDDPGFVEEAAPWLTKLHWYGAAGGAATRALLAEAAGDGAEAWRQRVRAAQATRTARRTYETVATGVVPPYLEEAAEASGVVVAGAPASAPAGSDVDLTAEVHAGDVDVQRVEWLAGKAKVGEDDAPPYSLTWQDAPEGLHLVRARAVAADGSAVTSAATELVVGDPAPVLLLVGDDAPVPEGAELSTGDAAVRDRLRLLGHPVEVMRGADSATGDAAGKAAVVISSTLASSEVGAKFRDVDVPVLTWEAYVLDDMAMATSPGEVFRASEVDVTAGTPLSAGLSGVVDVYRGADRVRFGDPSAGAEVAATVPGEPDRAALFGYAEGDAMVDLEAPARRVGLFLGDEGVDPEVVTDDGLALFDAAVGWALRDGTVAGAAR